MLAVIDTNTLLRMAAASNMSLLFVAWSNGRFELAMSQAILSELEDAATKPRVRRFLSAARLRWFTSLILDQARLVELAAEFPHCRDLKDDIVIATAVSARADFIVTSDSDLYSDVALVAHLRDEYNIRVAQPGEFLAILP